jgi:hypothetical protein
LVWRPWTSTVKEAAVVPDDDVAFAPVVAIDKQRSSAVFKEPAQQRVGFARVHTDNRPDVTTNKQRGARRLWIMEQEWPRHRGQLLCGIREVHSTSPLGRRVVVKSTEILDEVAVYWTEGVISGSHVGELGLAPLTRNGVGGQKRKTREDRLERGVGMSHLVTGGELDAPLAAGGLFACPGSVVQPR